MPDFDVRSLIGSLPRRISAVHPLVYMLTYLLAIPVFAGVYCIMPLGFYAPYAHREYSGQFDAYQAGITVQTAIRRTLHKRKPKPKLTDFEVREELLYVQRLVAVDDATVKFDVHTMLWDSEKKGLVQIFIPLIMRASSAIVIGSSDDGTKNFRVVELDNPERIPVSLRYLVDPAMAQMFQPADDILGKGLTLLEITNAEEEQIFRLFSGLGGNALAISGGFGRMLYFSTIVITTVGFGDVVPMTGLARGAVGTEALFGIIIAGLFLNAIAYRSSGGTTRPLQG
jgi:hypothetical protein